jgi:hypothetical protein
VGYFIFGNGTKKMPRIAQFFTNDHFDICQSGFNSA